MLSQSLLDAYPKFGEMCVVLYFSPRSGAIGEPFTHCFTLRWRYFDTPVLTNPTMSSRYTCTVVTADCYLRDSNTKGNCHRLLHHMFVTPTQPSIHMSSPILDIVENRSRFRNVLRGVLMASSCGPKKNNNCKPPIANYSSMSKQHLPKWLQNASLE